MPPVQLVACALAFTLQVRVSEQQLARDVAADARRAVTRQGMSLGAVYVYHSAVVRQLIGAAVIPVTMLVRRGGRSRGAACAAPTGANARRRAASRHSGLPARRSSVSACRFGACVHTHRSPRVRRRRRSMRAQGDRRSSGDASRTQLCARARLMRQSPRGIQLLRWLPDATTPTAAPRTTTTKAGDTA